MSTQAGVVEQQAESTEQAVVDKAALEATETAETQADAASAAASESTETQTDKSDGQQRGIERRFAKMTAQNRALAAEVEHWKSRALGTGEKSPTKAAETPKKPNPADFENTEAYLDARDEWVKQETLRVAREELQKAESEREKKSEAEVFAETWGEKEAALKEKATDYDEVTATAMETLQANPGPATAAVAHALQFSETGPELLYYLGQNPKEAQRLSQMHPTQAVIALGRIEARLAGDNAGGDQKPPMTRAPKPPNPVRKAGPVDNGELRDDLPMSEWQRRFLKKQEKARQ